MSHKIRLEDGPRAGLKLEISDELWKSGVIRVTQSYEAPAIDYASASFDLAALLMPMDVTYRRYALRAPSGVVVHRWLSKPPAPIAYLPTGETP